MPISRKSSEANVLKKTIVLLGGARSGKSHYAQGLAKRWEKVLFVATAEAGDADMQSRIEKHKQSRPQGWRTLEATTHLGSRIQDEIADESLVIIDCITLLISNIFCRYVEPDFDNIEESVIEKQVVAEIAELQECMRKFEASFIIVSNEVGLGLVPDNRMGRLYRDFLGRANQMLAQSADEVYLMVAGIPLRVKPGN
jgi:adenosylcobinamide kinase / adenosylcobinamide-phosphate guanylyltransferase